MSTNTAPKRMFGRRAIYTSEKEINRENLLTVLERTNVTHAINRGEIEYLYRYYRGDQPALYRTKEIRPEINAHVVENRAQEIVNFKTGYLCGEPIQYIACKETSDKDIDEVSKKVERLNGLMRTVGKASNDKSIVKWGFICGTAYRLCLPAEENEDGIPFRLVSLDPRQTYVIYSNKVDHKPLANVYYVLDEDGNATYSVYTPSRYFELKDGNVLIDTYNPLGMLPIVEYPANDERMGAFEAVLPILDAINEVDCDRQNGIQQFIQSLLVLYNCDLPEGETANTIRDAGMLLLKSMGDAPAKVDNLVMQLDQVGSQTLKSDMYRAVLEICGVPGQASGDNSDSSNNGAVILRNGWQAAEARAKDSELMFKQSENEFLRIALKICRTLSDVNLKVIHVDYRFTRRCYEDILTKQNVLTNMLKTNKIHPKLAFNVCGLFSDPESAYQQSMAWFEEHEGEDPEKGEDKTADAADSDPGGGNYVKGYIRN